MSSLLTYFEVSFDDMMYLGARFLSNLVNRSYDNLRFKSCIVQGDLDLSVFFLFYRFFLVIHLFSVGWLSKTEIYIKSIH